MKNYRNSTALTAMNYKIEFDCVGEVNELGSLLLSHCVSELFSLDCKYSQRKIVAKFVRHFPMVRFQFSVGMSLQVFIGCIERAD
jgi:hypothetical protein